MQDPEMREKLYIEACARHGKYFLYLALEGKLTIEILEDHKRMLQWYFYEGGWQ
jgi:hypothetical protein